MEPRIIRKLGEAFANYYPNSIILINSMTFFMKWGVFRKLRSLKLNLFPSSRLSKMILPSDIPYAQTPVFFHPEEDSPTWLTF